MRPVPLPMLVCPTTAPIIVGGHLAVSPGHTESRDMNVIFTRATGCVKEKLDGYQVKPIIWPILNGTVFFVGEASSTTKYDSYKYEDPHLITSNYIPGISKCGSSKLWVISYDVIRGRWDLSVDLSDFSILFLLELVPSNRRLLLETVRCWKIWSNRPRRRIGLVVGILPLLITHQWWVITVMFH